GKRLNEIADQERNVFSAVTQGRDADREHVQAVEQVAAEFAAGDHLFQIAVGCCDQPGVYPPRLRAAETFEFLLLQRAQQLRLDIDWDIAHLVQEQRALIRQFHAPDFLTDRTGERAFFMAEQFAFDEARRDGSAIKLYKCPLFAPAPVVDRTGNQLLSGAGFAQKQDGRITRSDG